MLFMFYQCYILRYSSCQDRPPMYTSFCHSLLQFCCTCRITEASISLGLQKQSFLHHYYNRVGDCWLCAFCKLPYALIREVLSQMLGTYPAGSESDVWNFHLVHKNTIALFSVPTIGWGISRYVHFEGLRLKLPYAW